MSVRENIRFNGQREMERSRVFSELPKVDLNNLMQKVKEEEKKKKRNNLVVSAAALSAVVVFGIIITL
jgi:hypothetical protein